MEDEVIADIARRVKKTGRYTETAELMAKSMAEQGYSAEKIQAEVMKVLRADRAYQMAVAENTKAYKQEIQDIIDKTVQAAKASGDTLIAEAGNMAWNNDLSMWQEHGADLKKPNNMSQLILAFQKQTRKQLRNLTRSMGFVNTVFGTTGIVNAYQREMDLALLKVATGAFSYDQAVNDCIKRLAKSGLRSIDYAGGRSYQLDTAARMCVRTGMSQLAGKVMEENLKSTGQDLVITSQHMGSRPEHAVWQNKVFSYSGKNKKYPDFVKSTGYGTVTGLKGANCTHDFYPFWEGASIIPEDLKEPEPKTIGGRKYSYYQMTQQQRKMERDIRATKREIEAQRAIGGDTEELENRLRVQKSDYHRFSNEAGLKVKNNRLRIVGGSSEIGNYQKSKTTVQFNGIISFKKNKKSNSAVDSLKKCNPKYETNKAFQENCQRCAPTYEMRRRGYDVIAKGKYLKYDPLAGDYTIVWDDPIYIQCTVSNGKDEIEKYMRDFGNGARVEIGIKWKDKPQEGHVFVAEQTDGKTVYYDPQSGVENCEDYFDQALEGGTSFVRTDNAKPNALIYECCEEWKND